MAICGLLESKRKISSIRDREFTNVILQILKFGFIIILGYVLYQQIRSNADTINLSQLWLKSNLRVVLVVVLPLMVVNWGIETIKWRSIVNAFEHMSLISAIRSVLCGVALAIVTPGRVGEYGGRLVGISKQNKSKAVIANVISSISQNVVNVSIGLVGMIAYCVNFLEMNYTTTVAICSIASIGLMIMVFLYFRLDLIDHFLARYKHYKISSWILKHTGFLSEYTRDQLLNILGLSFLRYAVYTSQYVILIMVCGVTNDPYHALLGVSVIFFIQSGLPLPPMLSVLARGEMAIWIWSVFSINVAAILTATFLLWMINLVIPTIAGSFILWRSKI